MKEKATVKTSSLRLTQLNEPETVHRLGKLLKAFIRLILIGPIQFWGANLQYIPHNHIN